MKRPFESDSDFILGAGIGPAAKDETVAAIEEVQLTPCPSDDPGRACAANHATAPKDFEAAMQGDYQAQRNTGYVLANAQPGIVRRPVQGCAWRMALLVSGSPEVNALDTANYQTDCASLSDADQAESLAVAKLIHQRIHGADLPPLPPLSKG